MKTDSAPSTGFVDFKQVKSSVTMLQVLERYSLVDTLKQTGDRLSGPCPIHEGKNPTSFRVSISKNCFNCFGSCGRGGNVIDFVALMEDIDFRDAALRLQEWFLAGPAVPARKGTRASRQRRKPAESPTSTSDPESESAESAPEITGDTNPPLSFELKTLKTDHPYPIERGLEPATIEHFGIGHCSRGMLRGHIAIPIHNGKGELVAYAGRWPGNPPEGTPKYKLPKGFRKALEIYNLHRALQEDPELPLVIVEGFFDCFALWQAGISKCVALMGCSMSDEQERLLADSLPQDTTIELLFDNDDAGSIGATSVAQRLARFTTVRIISLPKGIRQPDELSEDDMAEVFA